MNIRVAIADDHPALLAGMQSVLAGVRDITIVDLVRDSTQLVDLLGRSVVDVVVTDFSMPQGRYGDGLTLLRFLRQRFPQIPLVLLTSVENPQLLRSVVNMGVMAVVSKADDFACLEPAIRAARSRRTYLSPVVEKMIGTPDEDARSDVDKRLSKREVEVLRMFAEGLNLAEIGERVGRSRKTVSTQKLAAMKKLGLGSDADIFQYAISKGMIQASGVSRKDAMDADKGA